MPKIKIKYLDGIKNDIKISIDDLFNVVEFLCYDVKRLKLIGFKPDKTSAKGMLEYLKWKEGESKKNFESIVKNEIALYQDWLEIYCEENDCTEEEALKIIIEGP